jgi:hypothetical protein
MANSSILLTDSEIKALNESKSDREWDKACDEVKSARGGSYPADWFARVLVGGIMRDAQARWGK